jgi:medium-chain acyl-[acyl-carrier-protein] hydrolase
VSFRPESALAAAVSDEEQQRCRPRMDPLFEGRLRYNALVAFNDAKHAWLPWSVTGGDLPVLYCFPYAGGTAAAYRGWIEPAADRGLAVRPVELPGHGRRIRQSRVNDIHLLARLLCDELFGTAEPFAFFGHSMGGCMAYLVAHELRRRKAPTPTHLFISAALPPGVSHDHLYGLPDAELLAKMGQLGGVPPEVLEYREILDLMLPILRDDLAVVKQWEALSLPVAPCPITGFGGTEDPLAPPDALATWRAHTASSFEIFTFSGGHFYLNGHIRPLIERIALNFADRVTVERVPADPKLAR